MPKKEPKMETIKQFLDEGEPLGKLKINEEVYVVTAPENLLESEYINYFAARAEAMDAMLQVYGVENEDGELVLDNSKGALDSVRKAKLEALMLKPARQMVEALLGVPEGTFKKMKSKTIMFIYNYCESLLRPDSEEPVPSKSTEPEEDLEVPLDGKIVQE